MTGSIAVLSYFAAAAAFTIVSLLLATRWRDKFVGPTLLIACVVSAAWATLTVIGIFSPSRFSILVDLSEVARDGAWSFFLLKLILPSSASAASGRRPIPRMQFAFVTLYTVLVIATLLGYAVPALRQTGLGALVILTCRTAAAVMGMLFVEQLFRNADTEDRWGIKFACIGIGGLFGFDFYLYSDALLFRNLNVDIWSARGMINALVVPLIAVSIVRNPQWSPRLAVSRRILFHSATISGAALYLLTMAAAGYYLRYVGGTWGPIMQAAFLFAAVVLLVVILISGKSRAWLKVFISKHFYNYNYDYREEWLRFTRTLAEPGPGLESRAVRAIAALVESPAGLLFTRDDGDAFTCTSGWNLSLATASEPVDSGFSQFLQQKHWVIDLLELDRQPDRYESFPIPAWLQAIPNAWLVVPLLLQENLLGFIVLTESRSKIKVNWEVLDLLKIAGSQAASILSQKQASDALMVARQFESYNRMSTFVVHDLKNLVSQLSLLVANAERHRDSPEFQKDMLDTVSHSVDRMKLLLQKFSRGSSMERSAPIALEQAVLQAMASKSAGLPKPALDIVDQGLVVHANLARLERVIGHLIQNAMEATPKHGRIDVRLFRDGRNAVLEISDSGQGMSEEFIRVRLFQPFESTKLAGMGIGVFESREYISELGGSLEVTSKPAAGTCFRIVLPVHDDDDYTVLNATS